MTQICVICGDSRAAPFASQGGYDYASCRGCGFVYLRPMPDADTLSRIYNEDAGDIAVGRYPKAGSRMRRALMRAARFAPRLVGREMLDIGCGGGFMVEAMRRFGARATGIDIAEGAIAYARNAFPKAEFHNESFDAFLARGRRFDFLHSSEVIEHIGDAQGYMGFLAAVARPGARLFLTTPDIGHPAVPAEVTQWDMLAPPRHVHFFTEATLARLLAAHGFRIEKRYTKKSAPTLQVLARKVAGNGT